MNCRHCAADLRVSMIDLGSAPHSNAYLTDESLRRPERWYPLRVLVCTRCWLAQTEDFADRVDLFSKDYAYFSSYSTTWLGHCERFVDAAARRFALGASSRVVEIASNDGYLLQYVKARGIPCLGVEPTAKTAAACRDKGIEVVGEFFGRELARRLVADGWSADLTVANNVLAHVPDINDFLEGFALLLKRDGVASFEFPHLMKLLEEGEFDTIYHEHFSYLSLSAVHRIFARAGLSIFDVEEHPTHGGSLRVLAARSDGAPRDVSERVAGLLAAERTFGIETPGRYASFQESAERVKDDLLLFLIAERSAGRKVAAYGAAAKGNTLLNFAGVRPDHVRFVVDRNPEKVGKFMPGSRIPIVGEERLRTERPDRVLILPWNLTREVAAQISYVREWGCRIFVAIPTLREVAAAPA